MGGAFITFEGLDGCGKSTQMEKLAAALRAAGHEVVTTREPGGTAIGERIRELLLDSRTLDLDAKTELALMFAARAQHVEQVIRPALEAGRIVLSDRFTDSSEAYQGGGRKLGTEPVLALHRALCGDLQPQLTILLDCDPARSVGRARRRNRDHRHNGADENRFERENQKFFERVRQAYCEIARREPRRVVVIEAQRKIEVVHREVLAAVEKMLKIPSSVEGKSSRGIR